MKEKRPLQDAFPYQRLMLQPLMFFYYDHMILLLNYKISGFKWKENV